MTYAVKNGILCFSDNFNERLTDDILEIMKQYNKIKFGYHFNHEINNLPSNVTHIWFGKKFNQEINALPQGIVFINLGYLFNRSIDRLPLTLRKLILSKKFNQPMNNLPDNLEKLVINSSYDLPIDFLPVGLKKLKFENGSVFSQSLDNLPQLDKLQIPIQYPKEINNLPDSIKQLSIGVFWVQGKRFCFDEPILSSISIATFHFPHLENSIYLFDNKIQRFPANLEKLFIFRKYKYNDVLSSQLGDKLVIANPDQLIRESLLFK